MAIFLFVRSILTNVETSIVDRYCLTIVQQMVMFLLEAGPTRRPFLLDSARQPWLIRKTRDEEEDDDDAQDAE